MDKKSLEEARLASRTEYLKKTSSLRAKVAEKVINNKLNDIERGIVPESDLEATHLIDRAKQVQTALELNQVAKHRQELLDDRYSEEALREAEREQFFNHVPQKAFEMHGDFVKSSTPSASADNAFVEMDAERVRMRVEKKEYVEEKTLEDLNKEKANLLQEFHSRVQEQRKSLPIYQQREALLNMINENQVVVIVGETGCGKTTQLLQYLYEEGIHVPQKFKRKKVDEHEGENSAQNGQVGEDAEEEEEETRLICTQPRRLAAVSVAERVAQEMGSRCGSVVGYKVRFDEKVSAATRIVFLTDGIMLKEFTTDPDLNSVGAIMIDEAHERSLSTDILMGLLRDVIRRNKKIKIIVASATINADKFSDFFNKAPIFTIKGRTFPVETFYSNETMADYVTESAETAIELHVGKPLPGDILIFLPGQDAIETCAQMLRDKYAQNKDSMRPLHILPIYASLPQKEQSKIYMRTPEGSRKVVIATNIAETSITIDGVRYVVDCGLCKQNIYDPKAMVEELRIVPISQASATQRSGRAGRTQSGECFRLYTPYTFKNEFPPETSPEISRCSMSSVVLQLKALGIHNLLQFDFLDKPSTDSLERALDHLFLLGAMKADGALTRTGRRMAEFPLEPSMSKCLIKACGLGCGRRMAMAAAMLSLESVFINTRDPKERRLVDSAKQQLFAFGNGDVTGYIRLMEDWLRSGSEAGSFCRSHGVHLPALLRARDVMDQILKTFDRIGLEPGEDEKAGGVIDVVSITKALLSGFFFNVSKLELDMRTYRIVRPMIGEDAGLGIGEADARLAEIHPTSFLFKAGSLRKSGGGGSGEKDGNIPVVLQEKPPLVFFTQLRRTTRRYMINISAILEKEWVMEMAPENYFKLEELDNGLKRRPRN